MKRKEAAKSLWVAFGNVPMNPETECMEEIFCGFPIGTHREEIWHWFESKEIDNDIVTVIKALEEF